MKANKKVMAALLAAMMTVSAGAAVVSADAAVSGPGSSISNPISNKGWFVTNDGKYYYKTGDNTYASGWKLMDGKWYFLVPGDTLNDTNYTTVVNTDSSTGACYALVNRTASIKCADGTQYEFRFGKDGAMVTGWYELSSATGVDPIVGTAGNWEYYNANGVRQYGWIKIGANWFYIATSNLESAKVNEDGSLSPVSQGTMLANGTYSIGNVKYTFAANGVLVNEGQGWVKNGNNWYYVLKDGTKVTNTWREINGKWYYFDNSSVMRTGWIKVDGDWWYCNPNGDLVMNNWIQTNGRWYLVNASGKMLTGWVVRNGKTYFLDNSSNGQYAGAYGAMATGTITINYTRYTFDNSGALVSVNGQTLTEENAPKA